MELNAILSDVIRQAKMIGIPVSDKIAPDVVINTRAKKRYGRCVLQNGVYTIEVSAYIPKENLVRLHEVIAHEVLHTCPGCMNHGARWKSYAEKMRARYCYSIQRTAKEPLVSDDPSPARYLLVCTKCGMQFPRRKKSRAVEHPELYRCKCGGVLVCRTQF